MLVTSLLKNIIQNNNFGFYRYRIHKRISSFLSKHFPEYNPKGFINYFLITLLLVSIFSTSTFAQQNWFSIQSFLEISDYGIGFNIEAFDMNKDGKMDAIVGNWNDTYVYYGGYETLDNIQDLTYTGRMLAVCDYNGDGINDMIAMHFTGFDSVIYDYTGELLFYWGNNNGAIAIDTIPDYLIPLPTNEPTFERFALGYNTVGIQKGDLNGDGKTDLVFSSNNFGNGKGRLYIYMGKPIPTDTVDFIIEGQNYSAFIGDFFQVGNINGDNFDDLLFSSNRLTNPPGVLYDSINYLHIFYGNNDFSPALGNESVFYSSHVNRRDSTADWFVRSFSVDDINSDGFEDVIVGRTFYNYPHQSTVHYGSPQGIDTIPSFVFFADTTTDLFYSSGSTTQNIGDYNDDGYDDFIMAPSSYQTFTLHFGGPYVNNNNRYGARGYINADQVFPRKAVNMGDQTNDSVNDIATIVSAGAPQYLGYILFLYGYRIPTDVKEEKQGLLDFQLYQNYPNPFNPRTVIKYHLNQSSDIRIVLYNVLGKEITTLFNGVNSSGSYQIEVDLSDLKLSSGVYFYKMFSKGGEITKKMTFLK